MARSLEVRHQGDSGPAIEPGRRVWCATVAKLTIPLDATKGGEVLAGMLPMLTDIPDYAFCPATAKEVSLGKYFPTYAHIRSVLDSFVRKQRDREQLARTPRAIEGGPQEPYVPATPEAKAAVSALVSAFKSEREFVKDTANIDDRPPIKAAHPPDEILLRIYDQRGLGNSARAEALRRKINAQNKLEQASTRQGS